MQTCPQGLACADVAVLLPTSLPSHLPCHAGLDRATGARVAIKAMVNAASTARAAAREVEAAQRLTGMHGNITQLLAYFAEGGFLVLVWELVEGMDLLDRQVKLGGWECQWWARLLWSAASPPCPCPRPACSLNAQGGVLSEPKAAQYFSQLASGWRSTHVGGWVQARACPGLTRRRRCRRPACRWTAWRSSTPRAWRTATSSPKTAWWTAAGASS